MKTKYALVGYVATYKGSPITTFGSQTMYFKHQVPTREELAKHIKDTCLFPQLLKGSQVDKIVVISVCFMKKSDWKKLS